MGFKFNKKAYDKGFNQGYIDGHMKGSEIEKLRGIIACKEESERAYNEGYVNGQRELFCKFMKSVEGHKVSHCLKIAIHNFGREHGCFDFPNCEECRHNKAGE